MPRSVGTATFLKVENSSAFYLSIGLFNLESDSGKVIHFPFTGSGDGFAGVAAGDCATTEEDR
jgi:hypothetical protein